MSAPDRDRSNPVAARWYMVVVRVSITYREDFKAWWPDYDHAPEKCFRMVRDGLSDIDEAVRLSRKRNVCIQAAGHAGFWPIRLSKFFGHVYTFECEPVLHECLKRNVAASGRKNITISDHALGATIERVRMRGSSSAGSWRIDPEGACLLYTSPSPRDS